MNGKNGQEQDKKYNYEAVDVEETGDKDAVTKYKSELTEEEERISMDVIHEPVFQFLNETMQYVKKMVIEEIREIL